MNIKLTDLLKNFVDAQAGARNLSAPAYVRELIVAEQKRIRVEQTEEQARQKALKVAAEDNPFNKKKKQQQSSEE